MSWCLQQARFGDEDDVRPSLNPQADPTLDHTQPERVALWQFLRMMEVLMHHRISEEGTERDFRTSMDTLPATIWALNESTRCGTPKGSGE